MITSQIDEDGYLIFEPKQRYSGYRELLYRYDKAKNAEILGKILLDMRKIIPSEYRGRVTFAIARAREFFNQYGERGFIMWKFNPINKQLPEKKIEILY